MNSMELFPLPLLQYLSLPILLLVGLLEECLLGDSLVAMNAEWWLTLFLDSPETLLLGAAFVLVLSVVRFS